MLVPFAAGLVAGIASQLFWTALPPLLPVLACIPVLLCVASLLPPAWRHGVLCVAGGATGVAWAAWMAGALLASRLPPALEGRDILLEVTVVAQRRHDDGGTGWTVDAHTLPWAYGCQLPFAACRLRISSWTPMPMSTGETWQVLLRLQRPHAGQNPGSADFEGFLFGERVVATGQVQVSPRNQRLAPARGLAAWRAGLLDAALPLLGAGPGDIATDPAQRFARAVLPALVLDERSFMSPGQWRVLVDTGTAHLVAISGLHVALVWGAVFWCMALLRRRAVTGLRHDRGAVVVALLAALLYALLAGMPLPALRAVLMLGVAGLFLLWSGSVPVWRVWLAAGAAVLLADPLAVHAAGFWLSFGAVGLLLLLHDLHRRRPLATTPYQRAGRFLTALAGAQLLLSVLLLPLLWALFGSASISSVLANLPAIPLVNLLALPPALAGFLLAPVWPAAADLCIDLATAVLVMLWDWLVFVDAIALLRPLSLHEATAPALALVALALGGALLVRVTALRFAMLALLWLAWPVAPPLPHGVATACVLDVGQGMAVIMRTARHAVLYDTGPAWSEDRDAGRAVVLPALRVLGVPHPALVVVSRHDPDHAGGLASVLAAGPRPLLVAAEPEAVPDDPVLDCNRTREWIFDGVIVRVLPLPATGRRDVRACVLQLDAGGTRLLLPGDASRQQELALAARQGGVLASSVLVSSAHGSDAASTLTFLYRVGPRYVIHASGYRNRAGHPRPAVEARVRQAGAHNLSTATAGALCMRLDAAGVTVRGWRDSRRRYWH